MVGGKFCLLSDVFSWWEVFQKGKFDRTKFAFLGSFLSAGLCRLMLIFHAKAAQRTLDIADGSLHVAAMSRGRKAGGGRRKNPLIISGFSLKIGSYFIS